MMDRLNKEWELADAAEDSGDFVKAEKLFRRSAKKGNPVAMDRLATLLDDKRKPPRHRAAIYWYKKAISLGEVTAAWNLAMHYKNRSNNAMFVKWISVAASLGDEDAIAYISESTHR